MSKRAQVGSTGRTSPPATRTPARASPPKARPRAVPVTSPRRNGHQPRKRRGRVAGVVRRVPRAAWICALVAILNAVCWSLIMPPFQVPDEPDHFAYVQQLVEAGRPPEHLPKTIYSFEQKFALQDLDYYELRRYPQSHAISSKAQQERLESDLRQPLSRRGNGNAGVATNQPPLYYLLQTIPYSLGSSSSILDRLQLMRLLSTLMAGATALFGFLFLRELLPGTRWAWTVGGLGMALAPLLGYMSSGVNPDAMLYSVSAALFFCIAYAFRRGLTPKLGGAIGLVVILGLLTKLNFIGLVPGAFLGVIALAWREARAHRPRALISGALAIGIPMLPIVLYMIFSSVTSNNSFSFASKAVNSTFDIEELSKQLSYVWQFYLPRLPWMKGYFVGLSTTRTIWFDGLVGIYGWFDTTFPSWVYDVAIVPFVAIVALCARALVSSRASLRRRLPELVTYLAMSAGLLIAIGSTAFLSFLEYHDPGANAQPRYLMPLLVLWGAVLALAARGAGRRWGPAVGAMIVLLVLAHDIFSQLLVVSRYYG